MWSSSAAGRRGGARAPGGGGGGGGGGGKGGPAGASAARVAAGSGCRVVVIERAAFPRHRPGETLHPGLEPLLRQLGAWEAVAATDPVRPHGVWQDRPSGSDFSPYGADAGG